MAIREKITSRRLENFAKRRYNQKYNRRCRYSTSFHPMSYSQKRTLLVLMKSIGSMRSMKSGTSVGSRSNVNRSQIYLTDYQEGALKDELKREAKTRTSTRGHPRVKQVTFISSYCKLTNSSRHLLRLKKCDGILWVTLVLDCTAGD